MAVKNSHEIDIFQRAWPAGVPPEEKAEYLALSPEKARNVTRRLVAILDAEENDPRPIEELARNAGVSRSLFFELKRRWGLARSLSAIIPYRRVPSRGPTDRGRGLDIARHAAELVSQTPDYVAAGVVAREVAKLVGNPNAYRAALRHVRLARLNLSADPGYLAANYAQEVIIDLCACSLLQDNRLQMRLPDVAVVFDRASRLILGMAPVAPGKALNAQKMAAEQAISFLRDNRLDRPGDQVSRSVVEFVVGETNKSIAVRLMARFEKTPELNAVTGSARRYGQSITALIGARMGRLIFMPRSTGVAHEAALTATGDPLTTTDALIQISKEVALHNEPVLMRLRAAQTANRINLVPEGIMTKRLSLVIGALAQG